MDNISEIRTWYADELRFTAPMFSPRVIAAFASVPREDFCGPAPWMIETQWGKIEVSDPKALYHDVLIVLKDESGINNGRPGLWAAVFDVLELSEGASVLQVGAGTGYYSAILAECVGPSGQLTAVEIDASLAGKATDNLRPWPQVRVVCGDALTVSYEPVNAIVAFAGLNDIPKQWLAGLKDNGRLLIPLTVDGREGAPGTLRLGGRGAMLLVQRLGAHFGAKFLRPVSFIHCVGGRNETTGRRLAAAFKRGNFPAVRSLRLGTPPDNTCWVNGDGWWLSTAPP